MATTYTYKCAYCNKEFESPYKPVIKDGEMRPKFCCREHYLEYHKTKFYTCAYCGKVFKSYYHYDKKEKQPKERFCCAEHYHKYVKEVRPLNYETSRDLNCTCKVCGKKFHASPAVKKRGGNFCSVSCASKYNMTERMKKYSEDLNCTCAHCGKKFHKKSSAVGKLNFCTQDCRFAYHKARRVHKVCLTCGKEFDVTPDKAKRAKFCSVECYDEYQRRFFIETKCTYCGKPIRVSLTTQHHNKTGQYFCSNKCVGKFFRRENNTNFKGTSDVMKILRTYFGQYQRAKIFERDNKVCQICGGVAEHIHHIYPVSKMIKDFKANHPEIDITKNCYQVADMIIKEHPKFLDLSNLVAVCVDCHKDLHSAHREVD